ncbi:DUF5060 domain-containing protein [Cohnella fermenti]|uniref:DUF5060 domain-containing protein n=1 Tax=Cohnella fermenti TaxID=2565925 RepID=UPI002ED8CCB8
MFELALAGPSHGNPFVDVDLSAEFSFEGRTQRALGFYDGDGSYLIRFMPDREGEWTFRTSSNARSLDGIEGRFAALAQAEGNRGPVRVSNTYHFAYEDGTPYYRSGLPATYGHTKGTNSRSRHSGPSPRPLLTKCACACSRRRTCTTRMS